MSEITRVGVDLAKNVIQVNAVDSIGKVVISTKPCSETNSLRGVLMPKAPRRCVRT